MSSFFFYLFETSKCSYVKKRIRYSFINSIFRHMFLRFSIPWDPSLKSVLRNLLQPHVMTYISSHPEVFYRKVFLKVSQNSQENSCAEVSFSCNFNKNEALAPGGFLWIYKCFLRKCIYVLSIFESNNNKTLFITNAAVVLWRDWRPKILLLRSYL